MNIYLYILHDFVFARMKIPGRKRLCCLVPHCNCSAQHTASHIAGTQYAFVKLMTFDLGSLYFLWYKINIFEISYYLRSLEAWHYFVIVIEIIFTLWFPNHVPRCPREHTEAVTHTQKPQDILFIFFKENMVTFAIHPANYNTSLLVQFQH